MDLIRQYINQIIESSTPQVPLWNIEKLLSSKENAWNYIDGCMLRSLFALTEITGEDKYAAFAESYLSYYVADDGSMRGYRLEDYNLDNICEGNALFDAYQRTGKAKYHKAMDILHEQLRLQPRTYEGSYWHKAIYPNQVWLDGLYMAQVFAARYTSKFEQGAGYDDILAQYRTVRQRMFDEATGLYRHGYDASKMAFWAESDGKSPNPWLRSLGWYASSLVDVLEQVQGAKHPICTKLASLAKELSNNIKRFIDPKSDMLWQVPTRIGDEGNYPETSGSAMLAYFLMKGARLGTLDSTDAAVGKGIFDAICNRYLKEEDGKLTLSGICLVAGLGPEDNRRRDGSYSYYISEPIVVNDAKGLAPFLMSYIEVLRQ